MKWYVIRVFSGKENKIKEQIEKDIVNNNLEKYVEQVLIAKETYFQVRKGKKTKTERNFYPGYIMINCEMQGELLKNIKNINNVIGFLGTKGRPTPMTEREVNTMLKRIDDTTISAESSIDNLFKIGQTVTVNDGPFTSFSGNISKIDNNKKSVTVDILIFGRKTPVTISYDSIS